MDDFTIDMSLWGDLTSTEVDEEQEAKDSSRAGYEAYLQRRMNQCRTMTLKVIEDVRTGKRHSVLNHCGLAGCPICGPRLQEHLCNQIREQLAYGPLRQHSVYSKEERAKITRKYGKENLTCFPVETSEGVIRFDFLIKTKDQIGQEYGKVTDEDLANWSKKVYKHSKSGSLCASGNSTDDKPSSLPDDIIDDRTAIEREEYIIDFGQLENNENVCKEVERITLEETANLNPKTIDELLSALEIRRLKFREVVARHWGVILHVNIRIVMIRESDIDWQKEKNASARQTGTG